MPPIGSGYQSFAGLGGFGERGAGFKVLNPRPLDSYLGPWEAVEGTTTNGVALVNSIIEPTLRYQGQKVIILANSTPGTPGGETLAYVYWYRGGTADNKLEEFSSGSVGGAFSSSTSYNWSAPQYFSQGFSAAGGVTFNNNVVFNNGLSASGGATFSSIYGTALAIGTFYPNNLGSAEINNSGIITATGIRITNTSVGATFSNKVFVGELLSVGGGISANGGVTFANNVHVGGTLSVNGNFYVAGTLTTVNESQLVIQDKYLVLGSTLGSMAEYGTSAGIYIGTTTAPIASFAYNYNSGTNSHWVSNIPLYVGANEVLHRGNIGTATGITAERIRVNANHNNAEYNIVFVDNLTTPASALPYVDAGITYNPSTNTLSCTKIEAIVDGGIF